MASKRNLHDGAAPAGGGDGGDGGTRGGAAIKRPRRVYARTKGKALGKKKASPARAATYRHVLTLLDVHGPGDAYSRYLKDPTVDADAACTEERPEFIKRWADGSVNYTLYMRRYEFTTAEDLETAYRVVSLCLAEREAKGGSAVTTASTHTLEVLPESDKDEDEDDEDEPALSKAEGDEDDDAKPLPFVRVEPIA